MGRIEAGMMMMMSISKNTLSNSCLAASTAASVRASDVMNRILAALGSPSTSLSEIPPEESLKKKVLS